MTTTKQKRKSTRDDASSTNKKVTVRSKGSEYYKEIGHQGGLATAASHDHAFYQDIGRRGGQKVADERGADYYRDIGHRGGAATAATHSREFYQDIGRRGGQKVAKERGPEYYRDIGHRGGEATAAAHDRGFYQDIGRRGGQKMAQDHDSDYYRDIGHRGGVATAASHDRAYYQDIGRRGGKRGSQGGDGHQPSSARDRHGADSSHHNEYGDEGRGSQGRSTHGLSSHDRELGQDVGYRRGQRTAQEQDFDDERDGGYRAGRSNFAYDERSYSPHQSQRAARSGGRLAARESDTDEDIMDSSQDSEFYEGHGGVGRQRAGEGGYYREASQRSSQASRGWEDEDEQASDEERNRVYRDRNREEE